MSYHLFSPINASTSYPNYNPGFPFNTASSTSATTSTTRTTSTTSTTSTTATTSNNNNYNDEVDFWNTEVLFHEMENGSAICTNLTFCRVTGLAHDMNQVHSISAVYHSTAITKNTTVPSTRLDGVDECPSGSVVVGVNTTSTHGKEICV